MKNSANDNKHIILCGIFLYVTHNSDLVFDKPTLQ